MPEPVLCYVSDRWAYFTTCPLKDQWGDDWNDRYRQMNAGPPYERDGFTITEVGWDGPYTPAPELLSVADINTGEVPWLTPIFKTGKPIFAGTPLSEFKQAVKVTGGKVWVEEK